MWRGCEQIAHRERGFVVSVLVVLLVVVLDSPGKIEYEDECDNEREQAGGLKT
jgi:hypothetical protein